MPEEQAARTGSSDDTALKRSTTWIGRGAKLSHQAVDAWVREPGDKKESRIRLGWIGGGVVVAIVAIASKPLPVIGTLLIGTTVLFAVLSQYGDVLLKNLPKAEGKSSPDAAPPSPESEGAPRSPEDLPEDSSRDPRGEFGQALQVAVTEYREAAGDPALPPPAEEVELADPEISCDLLGEEPTQRLHDTVTLRLRPGLTEPHPESVATDRPRIDFTKSQQPQLPMETGPMVGAGFRIQASGPWVEIKGSGPQDKRETPPVDLGA